MNAIHRVVPEVGKSRLLLRKRTLLKQRIIDGSHALPLAIARFRGALWRRCVHMGEGGSGAADQAVSPDTHRASCTAPDATSARGTGTHARNQLSAESSVQAASDQQISASTTWRAEQRRGVRAHTPLTVTRVTRTRRVVTASALMGSPR